jgi:hypothetical protein
MQVAVAEVHLVLPQQELAVLVVAETARLEHQLLHKMEQ